eukprot:scaffold2843_cov465-Pavlova_lutheri.AAC.2
MAPCQRLLGPVRSLPFHGHGDLGTRMGLMDLFPGQLSDQDHGFPGPSGPQYHFHPSLPGVWLGVGDPAHHRLLFFPVLDAILDPCGFGGDRSGHHPAPSGMGALVDPGSFHVCVPDTVPPPLQGIRPDHVHPFQHHPHHPHVARE